MRVLLCWTLSSAGAGYVAEGAENALRAVSFGGLKLPLFLRRDFIFNRRRQATKSFFQVGVVFRAEPRFYTPIKKLKKNFWGGVKNLSIKKWHIHYVANY